MRTEKVLEKLKDHVENIKHDLIKDNNLYTEEEAKELAKQAYYKGRNDENPQTYRSNHRLSFVEWFNENKKQ